jgi:hypothetical protein
MAEPHRGESPVPEVEVEADEDLDETADLSEEDARSVTSEPVELEDGNTTRIAQQNVGTESIGSGEFPDPDAPPVEPAPGAD